MAEGGKSPASLALLATCTCILWDSSHQAQPAQCPTLRPPTIQCGQLSVTAQPQPAHCSEHSHLPQLPHVLRLLLLPSQILDPVILGRSPGVLDVESVAPLVSFALQHTTRSPGPPHHSHHTHRQILYGSIPLRSEFALSVGLLLGDPVVCTPKHTQRGLLEVTSYRARWPRVPCARPLHEGTHL